MRNQNGRGAVGALSDGKKTSALHLETSLMNVTNCCCYANSSSKADQSNEEILKNAHLCSFGNVAPKDQPGESGAPLAKVKEINRKFKRKRERDETNWDIP